jgi:hypothetical protein
MKKKTKKKKAMTLEEQLEKNDRDMMDKLKL